MRSDSVFIIAILLAFVLFAGEPDIVDAIRCQMAPGLCVVQP